MSRRKSQADGGAAAAEYANKYEEELGGTYKKIHKTLGTNNKNKDIRLQVKGDLEDSLANQLTTGMNLTINPRFQLGLEKDMASTFKSDFKGEVE